MIFSPIKNENGNVIWFILLAVALMGFLTAVISRSSSSVDQTGSIEQNRIKASALLRYSQSVANAVERLRLQGISENDMDFIAAGASYDNTNCNDTYCEVFAKAGGGIPYRLPGEVMSSSTYTDDWLILQANFISELGCDTISTSCNDLLLVASDIPSSICLQVNAVMDTTNPSGDAPEVSDFTVGTTYAGSYNVSLNSDIIGSSGNAPELNKKAAGCLLHSGTYHFYQVLIAR